LLGAAVGAAVMANHGGDGPRHSEPPAGDITEVAPPEPFETGREAMHYDGKPFAYWQTYCRTELKPERRIEALKALAAFGANGYAEEAAEVVMKIAEDYSGELRFRTDWHCVDVNDKTTPNGKVVSEALETSKRIGAAMLPALLKGLDDPRTQLFCELTLSELPLSRPVLAGLLQGGTSGAKKEQGLLFRILGWHRYEEGVETLLSEALEDEAAVRAFVAAVLAESRKEWEAKENADAACWLSRLKPHADVVVPLLVVRLNELKEARLKEVRAAELEQAAKPVAVQNLSYQQMPSAVPAPAGSPAPETPETRLKKQLANLESPARTASKQLVEILGEFGPAAADALPVLREASADPCTVLQQAADAATRQVQGQPKSRDAIDRQGEP
jgi:hypothetical protein